MVQAQQYLDKKYPQAERKQVKRLDLRKQNLTGSLDLSDFVNLEKLNCFDNQLTNLNLIYCAKLKVLRCYSNHLTSLDLSNCEKLEEVSCHSNQLTNLSLPKRFPKLTWLGCGNNQLKSLDLTIFSNLNHVRCSDNQLTEIKLPTAGEELRYLDLSNNFLQQDLSFLSRLVNLKHLDLGNNHFFGNLEPLKDLDKLESLVINDTDLDSGLEHLPDSIQDFSCSTDKRKEAKVRIIARDWNYCGEDVKAYKKLIEDTLAQEWLDKKYPKEERAESTFLHIRVQNLTGGLRLKGFTKLEELRCSTNQLTHLDLSDCKDLKELDAPKNNLTSLHFLKSVPKLERLYLDNNPNLPKDSLKFIAELKELRYLDISYCPFEGNLKPLAGLTRLEKLYITNTNLSTGLECLPESLKEIYCDSDPNYKSIKIIKGLEKHLEGEDLHDFSQWRKNKNNSVAATVPLEKLYVIRGNLIRFLNKWGAREENKSEVSKLQDPNEISSYWYVGESGQWIARGTAVAGGILAATVDPILGGVLAAASPIMEVFSTQLKERVYEAQEKEWSAYSEDLEDLLNNYHELLGIIEMIVIGKEGEVNTALRKLKTEIDVFLDNYDADKDRIVDIEELKSKEGKGKFARDLNKGKKNQLQKIIEAIEKVKEEIIKYYRRNEKDEVANQVNTSSEKNQEADKLKTKLQEAEANYQKAKEKLAEKKKQNKEESSNEESESVKQLEQELSKLEQEIKDVKEEVGKQQMRNKFVELENQLKNLGKASWWGGKISQGLGTAWNGTKYSATKIYDFLTAPSWYREQWNNRNLLVADNNSDSEKELAEFIDNQEEIQESVVIIDLDKHFEEKETKLSTQQEIPPK